MSRGLLVASLVVGAAASAAAQGGVATTRFDAAASRLDAARQVRQRAKRE